jgi:glycosyltransferase involved in cell wall biosynthesis
MKILEFCPYYPPHIGGLENHADEFNKYLSQKGVDITVFTPRLPREALENETLHSNVKIIRFPAFEIISNYPLPKFWSPWFWRIFFALFKTKFDIVISRTRFFNTSLLAFFYAKIKKVRWIHIEHGSGFVGLTSNFKTLAARLYDYTLGSLVLKKSDLNVSISQAVQEFVKKFDNRFSPVIYRGLDFNKLDETEADHEFREKYKDKLIIVFAGRLYQWKGVEKSIRAVNQLPAEFKAKIKFFIIGDGEDFDDLKQMSQEPVELLSSLPREKVIGILKVADIYIHSSLPGGGLSTSLLEAMYCGCSIIATPNEGAREIIRHEENGILIQSPDPELIGGNIVKLLENENSRKKYSTAAKEMIRGQFDWAAIIENYLNHIL